MSVNNFILFIFLTTFIGTPFAKLFVWVFDGYLKYKKKTLLPFSHKELVATHSIIFHRKNMANMFYIGGRGK